MFEYFFRRYKQDVYGSPTSNVKAKNIPWYEWALLIFTVLLLLSIPICAAIKRGPPPLYLTFAMLVIMILFLIVDNRTLKKAADSLFAAHKTRLVKLRNLLQDDNFQFYNEKQIDWLITVCMEEIGPDQGFFSDFSNYFSKFIFPLV